MNRPRGGDAEIDDHPEWDGRPAPEILAEMTGRPASDFEPDEYTLPPFDEWVSVDE